jgi:hypothetical protein
MDSLDGCRMHAIPVGVSGDHSAELGELVPLQVVDLLFHVRGQYAPRRHPTMPKLQCLEDQAIGA